MSPDSISLSEVSIDPRIALNIPMNIASRSGAIAFARVDDQIFVAAKQSTYKTVASVFAKYLPGECSIIVDVAEDEEISESIRSIYGKKQVLAEVSDNEESKAMIIVSKTLDSAAISGASDIHINPDDSDCVCSFRVDGVIQEHETYAIDEHQKVVSRIKVLADLDISERRIPQDGKFRYQAPNFERPIDVRVATIPTLKGEKITLRLIGALDLPESFSQLGMSEEISRQLEDSLNLSQGMIVVTGPTGSGKSTTLYTCLQKLSRRKEFSIISLEDPVEYEIEGVTQVSIDHENTSFSNALRSCLRHDPDVLLVGEIRDKETAEIAIRAALTGHLVLSTLHTNSAAGTPERFIDMGVADYLISSTLSMVISQRLVRGLCDKCLEATTCDVFEKSFKASGCKYCKGSGFKTRSGIFESLRVGTEIAEAINTDSRESSISSLMKEHGMPSIWDDAKNKVQSGKIDSKTALRAVGARE